MSAKSLHYPSLSVISTDGLRNKMKGEKIQVKGFIVQAKDGHYYLTDHPNLRSCCLPKVNKIQLEGSFPNVKINKVTTLSGTLKKYEDDLLLKDAVLVEKQNPYLEIVGVLLVSTIIALLLFQRKRARQAPPPL